MTMIISDSGVQFPDASVQPSALTTGTQTIAGAKTFSGNVTFSAQAGDIKSGTAQNTTSGTFIDFTGIPSYVKRITVMFNGVSTNGTSIKQIQLGTSGGVVATGYLNGTSILAGTVASQNTTTGFGLYSIAAADLLSGAVVFTNVSGNTWACQGNVAITGGANISIVTAGVITLGGTLDRIRITTVNGTDTFDAGSVNILYEG